VSKLENGMVVQHASLGLGKVVALEPKAVHVFFAGSESRFATKLRLPLAQSLLTPSADGNAWLSKLPDFAFDTQAGRYGHAKTWLTHAEAVARFLEAYPGGFADPRYVGDGKFRPERPARWRRAHETFVEGLGGEEGPRLLGAGDLAELTRRALAAERKIRPLQDDAERPLLETALADPAVTRPFLEALLDHVATPVPTRDHFEALLASLEGLPGAAQAEGSWSLVTVLPFIARPDVHLPLRPASTCEAAQRLGLDIGYEPRPCWSTYSALLGAGAALLEQLRPIGARDLVDLEAFMHVTRRPVPKAARAAAS
jgi:hypothetical protein